MICFINIKNHQTLLTDVMVGFPEESYLIACDRSLKFFGYTNYIIFAS